MVTPWRKGPATRQTDGHTSRVYSWCMVSVALLLVLAIAALLVPELRAEPGTWVVSGVLVGLAFLRVIVGHSGGAIRTARQVKYARWSGYTSHDGTGERDIREKRGD